jgi:hypothetical protein
LNGLWDLALFDEGNIALRRVVTNTLQVLPLAPCQFMPGRLDQPFGRTSGCQFQ